VTPSFRHAVWFDGADEGFEREAERRRRLGLSIPDRASLSYFLIFMLVTLQAIAEIASVVFVRMTAASSH
jgi:hypothetical protein